MKRLYTLSRSLNSMIPLRPYLICLCAMILFSACSGNDNSSDAPDLDVASNEVGEGNAGSTDANAENGSDQTDGSGGSDGSEAPSDLGGRAYVYEVEITNGTASQPLSPIALVAHSSDYDLFRLGQRASVPLEELAEGGDNSALLAEAAQNAAVLGTASGEGPLPPGTRTTIRIEYTPSNMDTVYLAGVSMLVNTNDAIAAWQRIPISSLHVDETRRFSVLTYDTGTELNTETAETMPGPAANGEGFAEARDDIIDAVLIHAGVVTSDGGLPSSALGGIYKWDHPALNVLIRRIQ